MPRTSVEIVDDLPRDTRGAAIVVVDVIRAFATAALVFEVNPGAKLYCLASIRDLETLPDLHGLTVIAEATENVLGFAVVPNSPAVSLPAVKVATTIAQVTSTGTKLLVAAGRPRAIFAASALTATATARVLAEAAANRVIIACAGPTGEDQACAEFIRARLLGEPASGAALSKAIVAAGEARIRAWESPATDDQVESFRRDVEICADVDRVEFALEGQRIGQAVTLTPTYPTAASQ